MHTANVLQEVGPKCKAKGALSTLELGGLGAFVFQMSPQRASILVRSLASRTLEKSALLAPRGLLIIFAD